MLSRKILICDLTQKIYHIDKKKLSSLKIFLSKNTFEVSLQYLFNVFILFNTVFLLKFKLKVDPKTRTFKNLEKICLKSVATLYHFTNF